ncbi:MAG: hypothetical protein WA478_11750, partial [Pseudolabrys sp.]
RTKISAQWYRSRHDEPPAFAMLNQTRAHPGIARESKFQGPGIRQKEIGVSKTRKLNRYFSHDNSIFLPRVVIENTVNSEIFCLVHCEDLEAILNTKRAGHEAA